MADTLVGTKGLQVIGAGFGRTGTLSLKTALEELGFGPCYHMTEVFKHLEHFDLWEKALDGEQVEWQDIFANYRATLDWPACSFYQELIQAYPDAKVLLTVRDPEKWYTSVTNTIYRASNQANKSLPSRFLQPLVGLFLPFVPKIGRLGQRMLWRNTFHGKFEDRDYAIAIFNQHIEEVKRTIPPEKLLVYNVKEGWEPLCNFLGVEVPQDKPFPHLNDSQSFAGNRIWQQIRARMFRRALLAGAALLGIALVFWWQSRANR